MGCFNMYILNREGTCLYYHEWKRPRPCDLPPEDDQKNMFGLLFALRTFTAALDPISGTKPALGEPFRIGEGCSFHSFRTNNYKLHFMESPSGFKLVLSTDPEVGDLRDHLWHIYTNIFVEYVVKHPLYQQGEPFSFELFLAQLNRYIQQLGI